MRECLSCVKSCKHGAITVNENYTCLKIDKIKPIYIDPEICTNCGICTKSCLIGDITMSALDCTFCIICSGSPHCIINEQNDISFRSFISAIFKIVLIIIGL